MEETVKTNWRKIPLDFTPILGLAGFVKEFKENGRLEKRLANPGAEREREHGYRVAAYMYQGAWLGALTTSTIFRAYSEFFG